MFAEVLHAWWWLILVITPRFPAFPCTVPVPAYLRSGMRTARTRCLDEDDDNEGVSDSDDLSSDDDVNNETCGSRFLRIASPSRMLTRGEIAGGLGDLGTFLPDVVALSKSQHGVLPNPAAMVFFSGLWSAWAGLIFDLPMPIQPMHAVVAVSLTEGLSPAQIVASGVWLGGFFLLLGSVGLIAWCQRAIPLSVVRGLQLGLGLKVFATGVSLASESFARGWDRDTLAMLDAALVPVSTIIAMRLYGDRLRPASLVLFAIGICRAILSLPPVSIAPSLPVAPMLPSDITADDWWQGLVRSALPQLPVTLLNAVVSTAKLADDLYPQRQRPATVSRISLSIALMNLSTSWLGHYPSCHGCGGLAAQHLFGARSGSSMVLMGAIKMLVAVLLGPGLVHGLEAFPNAILGVLLALSGVELAATCRDVAERHDAAVMLIGAGSVLQLGTGPAFVVSVVAAVALRSFPQEPA